MRRARARIEQAQVVVDLRGGAHGAARVVAGGLLLDDDGGAEGLDCVYVGLLHQLQALPPASGPAFHITTPALRIARVGGPAALA